MWTYLGNEHFPFSPDTVDVSSPFYLQNWEGDFQNKCRELPRPYGQCLMDMDLSREEKDKISLPSRRTLWIVAHRLSACKFEGMNGFHTTRVTFKIIVENYLTQRLYLHTTPKQTECFTSDGMSKVLNEVGCENFSQFNRGRLMWNLKMTPTNLSRSSALRNDLNSITSGNVHIDVSHCEQVDVSVITFHGTHCCWYCDGFSPSVDVITRRFYTIQRVLFNDAWQEGSYLGKEDSLLSRRTLWIFAHRWFTCKFERMNGSHTTRVISKWLSPKGYVYTQRQNKLNMSRVLKESGYDNTGGRILHNSTEGTRRATNCQEVPFCVVIWIQQLRAMFILMCSWNKSLNPQHASLQVDAMKLQIA